MAGLRFTELQSRPIELLDFTSLTLDEFQQLVPPFEAAFHARMATWRMDGKPRTARRLTVYQNCPLPTPEDRLLFILVYLKTYALQVVQGRLFGMVQSKAHRWIHLHLPVLLAALRALGDAPARSLTALAQRLGVAEAAAATLVTPLEEAAAPEVAVPAGAPASPLLPMTGRNDASSAPKTLVNSKRVMTLPQSGRLDGGEQPQGLPDTRVPRLFKVTVFIPAVDIELLLVAALTAQVLFCTSHRGAPYPLTQKVPPWPWR